MASLLASAADTRRRTCVVCSTATPHCYVTSFTRVVERQEEWIAVLANGDVEFADELRTKLSTGRKYLCLDHFDRSQMALRKNGDGIEIIRNSVPMPFKNSDFVRNRHEEFRTAAFGDTPASSPPVPPPKTSFGLEGKDVTPGSMAFLMNTANFYVERAMLEAEVEKGERQIN